MKNKIRGMFLIAAVSLFFQGTAAAYFDPGTGGYLITSMAAVAGTFFAAITAFVLYFFRNFVGKGFCYFWKKKRLLLLAVILAFMSIGYQVTRQEPALPKFDRNLSGASTLDAASVSPGYNFYQGKLIDNQGSLIHQWLSPSLGIIDKNGDYYAQKYLEAPVWGRSSWDDKVIWEKNIPIHHEILLTPQNTIMTFTKEVREYQGRQVEFDVILEFDKGGRELRRYSFWEHLKEFQQYHRKLELDMPPTVFIPEDHRKEKSVWGGHYDYYHLNSLALIPENRRQGTHPAFQPGNWLITLRHGSMVFILDKDTQKILWRAIDDQVPNRIEGPHTASMLENGNILLFDNGRYRKWSRVLELDPSTLKPVWEYQSENFYTLSQGAVQRLENGNLLITVAEQGRVFELTPDKKIVWEYYHPEPQTAQNSPSPAKWGLRQEIDRMTRYPSEIIEPLLSQ